MKILRHRSKHIVVADVADGDELPEQVKVLKRIGLDDSVTGVNRRGAPPKYDRLVSRDELEVLDASSLTKEMIELAKAAVQETKEQGSFSSLS